MYSRFQLFRKYLRYYLTASSGKGFGIHSPFVFDFVKMVLKDRRDFEAYCQIEGLRSELLKNNTLIEVQDFGAGKVPRNTNDRTIADITRHSAKNKKMGKLLFRIAGYYRPETIVELGTSVGLSTAYLAAAHPAARLITLEGAGKLALQAKENFEILGLHNIEIVTGNFDENLPVIIRQLSTVGLVFMDGNHRKEPTLNYFNCIMEKIDSSSLIIVDDLHWSREMEEAWKIIKEGPRVMMTIDLFFMGLVFFRKSFKSKQHFTIRF